MPKVEQKQVVIKEINDKVKNSKSMVLVNSRGLTVQQDTILRKKLREAGVDYKVYKNTMVNFAIKDTQYEGLSKYLEGPTAIAFSYDDAVTAARIISKELKAMPKLEFKAGVIEEEIYDAKGVEKIAGIPSKPELLSKLLGSFKAPMASFARVLKALAEKEASPAPTEETPKAETPKAEAPAEAAPIEEAPVAQAETVEEAPAEAAEPAAE